MNTIIPTESIIGHCYFDLNLVILLLTLIYLICSERRNGWLSCLSIGYWRKVDDQKRRWGRDERSSHSLLREYRDTCAPPSSAGPQPMYRRCVSNDICFVEWCNLMDKCAYLYRCCGKIHMSQSHRSYTKCSSRQLTFIGIPFIFLAGPPSGFSLLFMIMLPVRFTLPTGGRSLGPPLCIWFLPFICWAFAGPARNSFPAKRGRPP